MSPLGLSDRHLAAIRGALACFPEIERARIYGSRAKGTHQQFSDIDLALDGMISSRCLSRLAEALDDLFLPYEIDLTLIEGMSNPDLLEHIQRVGVEIYQRAGEGTSV